MTNLEAHLKEYSEPFKAILNGEEICITEIEEEEDFINKVKS
jgi:saccharopine dehydrogenase-like NADP-dependent oxidoreductase